MLVYRDRRLKSALWNIGIAGDGSEEKTQRTRIWHLGDRPCLITWEIPPKEVSLDAGSPKQMIIVHNISTMSYVTEK